MQTPERGFYYHYKHDPDVSINNYAYELISVGNHTETGEHLVIYRSLYQTEIQKDGQYWLRPLDMWAGDVTKEGKTIPRFQRVTDPEVISQLEAIKSEMY